MSSKSTASTAAQADEGCPECGGPVYYEPMCTNGTADQVTSGTACVDCSWYELDEPSTPDVPDEGCPECGGPVYYEPMCTNGTADQVTSGTACVDCSWYELDEPSTPDVPEEGVIREGAIDLGNKGETRTSHPNYDADRNVYVDPGGCPECSADLEICLIGNRQAAYSIQPEFRAMAEICTEYGDGDDECSHRAP